MIVLKRLLFGSVLMALGASGAVAQEVLLTLTGAVADGEVKLTRADLDALEWHEIATSTSVTDGQPVFRGVLMRDILDRAQASGDTVTARALNDYVIEIPMDDFHEFDVIAALYMDGIALTPRDKGPVWIVYPRDDHSVLADIRYDMRWVWQLSALHVQ
ncbi:molybdopterin-dependent oxidoreductase [Thalassorhabdomicrobium marinisediminis]|uniref:Oxidoreductase molybdopterin-binding domain-containing protein n=1 Tax=Thalassorhabdomicrobium marinisediminis TaxID=2170577 RepID=A0A2T7FTT2_9RHOB|nr:molybdopterin-dependent oxidoreductase [Thalassorhabdomicrobium marinisediminis]PVA05578.1 hypothetical protein DC363_13915 [Thalassorhabdomicrobium marinisediminis]